MIIIFILKPWSLNPLAQTVLKSDYQFSRYCKINILKSHISIDFNQIEMVFSVINGKPFPVQAAEKIFQIGQVVQNLLPYFNLHVNTTQLRAIFVKYMHTLSLSFGFSIHKSVTS